MIETEIRRQRTPEERAAIDRAWRERYEKRVREEHQTDALAKAFREVEYSWTLPIVRNLANGPVRTLELRVKLGCSAESLRTALARMMERGLVFRTAHEGAFPRRVDYELTERGRGLIPVVDALAAWAEAGDG